MSLDGAAADDEIGRMDTLSLPIEGIVRGACPHDCPDTCAMLVHVRDGRAVRVQGDPRGSSAPR